MLLPLQCGLFRVPCSVSCSLHGFRRPRLQPAVPASDPVAACAAACAPYLGTLVYSSVQLLPLGRRMARVLHQMQLPWLPAVPCAALATPWLSLSRQHSQVEIISVTDRSASGAPVTGGGLRLAAHRRAGRACATQSCHAGGPRPAIATQRRGIIDGSHSRVTSALWHWIRARPPAKTVPPAAHPGRIRRRPDRRRNGDQSV